MARKYKTIKIDVDDDDYVVDIFTKKDRGFDYATEKADIVKEIIRTNGQDLKLLEKYRDLERRDIEQSEKYSYNEGPGVDSLFASFVSLFSGFNLSSILVSSGNNIISSAIAGTALTCLTMYFSVFKMYDIKERIIDSERQRRIENVEYLDTIIDYLKFFTPKKETINDSEITVISSNKEQKVQHTAESLDDELKKHKYLISTIRKELETAGKGEYAKPAVIEYLLKSTNSYDELQDAINKIKIWELSDGGLYIEGLTESFSDYDYSKLPYHQINNAIEVNKYGVERHSYHDTYHGEEKETRENNGYPIVVRELQDHPSTIKMDNGDILLDIEDYGNDLTFEENYYYYTSRYPELKEWYSDYYGVNEENVRKYSEDNEKKYIEYTKDEKEKREKSAWYEEKRNELKNKLDEYKKIQFSEDNDNTSSKHMK